MRKEKPTSKRGRCSRCRRERSEVKTAGACPVIFKSLVIMRWGRTGDPRKSPSESLGAVRRMAEAAKDEARKTGRDAKRQRIDADRQKARGTRGLWIY